MRTLRENTEWKTNGLWIICEEKIADNFGVCKQDFECDELLDGKCPLIIVFISFYPSNGIDRANSFQCNFYII